MATNKPNSAPLEMPVQNLRRAFRDPLAPPLPRAGWRLTVLRLTILGLPLAVAAGIGTVALAWFGMDQEISVAEAGLVASTVFAVYWVAVSLFAAIAGLMWREQKTPAPAPDARPQRIAIMVPMYGEEPAPVISHAVSLCQSLMALRSPHSFGVEVISDTRDLAKAALEEAEVAQALRNNPGLALNYRRREQNTDYKSGNIKDWITKRGHLYDSMLVLDADSVMGPQTVLRLIDEFQAEPALGLAQAVNRSLPGETLWQRLQHFSSEVYGVNLARGFAMWSGHDGNFFGHNALIRIRAFADSAGLPHLPGRRPMGGVILSHDFVEAALLRRAGWGVKMIPEAIESYEEAPANLISYVKRDNRWCQGNMQHLRIMTKPGLHPLSRFHLAQGVMGYIGSLWWLGILAMWAMVGDGGAIRYFTGNPYMPHWPNYPVVTQAMLAGAIAILLLGPKAIGTVAFLRKTPLAAGQPLDFVAFWLLEVLLSMMMAPILMVHQVRAVLRTFAGFDSGWAPHFNGTPPLMALIRFHAVETVIGAALLGAVVLGFITPWLAPVAVCLLLAVPLSWLVAREMEPRPSYAASQKA